MDLALVSERVDRLWTAVATTDRVSDMRDRLAKAAERAVDEANERHWSDPPRTTGKVHAGESEVKTKADIKNSKHRASSKALRNLKSKLQ